MLVLNRKVNRGIRIGGNGEIYIVVVEIGRENVRLGIECPKDIPIMREELTKSFLLHKDGDSDGTPERSGLFGQREPGKGRLRTAVGNLHKHLEERHTALVNIAADSPAGTPAAFKAVAQAAVLSDVLVLIRGALDVTEHAA